MRALRGADGWQSRWARVGTLGKQRAGGGGGAGGSRFERPGLSPHPGLAARRFTPAWRQGVVYLPAELLKAGENHFQFTVQDAAAGTPVAVKDSTLQLKYRRQASSGRWADRDAFAHARAADQAPQQQPTQPDPDAIPCASPRSPEICRPQSTLPGSVPGS